MFCQFRRQESFFSELGFTTVVYDQLGQWFSKAPCPRDRDALLQTYSIHAHFADLEAILQLCTKVWTNLLTQLHCPSANPDDPHDHLESRRASDKPAQVNAHHQCSKSPARIISDPAQEYDRSWPATD